MVKIINYFCGKCNVKIPVGEEFSLQLIDRENDHHITTDALKIEKQEDGIFKSKDGAYYKKNYKIVYLSRFLQIGLFRRNGSNEAQIHNST